MNVNSCLRSEFKLEQLLARGNSRLKVLQEKFVRVPTGGYQFITFVQGRQFRSTNDKIFLPQTQITAVRDRAIGSGLFQKFPGDSELQLCLLQIPNEFTELCTQSLAEVVERRFVVGKFRFKRGLT